MFTGSFSDMGLARTTCEGILDEGADVMLPVGGAINLPCGDAIIARGADAALIGVDADAFFAMPDTYKDLWLVTIEKGIAVQVTRSIQAHAEGTWTPGGTVGTAANGSVGLSRPRLLTSSRPLSMETWTRLSPRYSNGRSMMSKEAHALSRVGF
jgi:basic membrane protein A